MPAQSEERRYDAGKLACNRGCVSLSALSTMPWQRIMDDLLFE